MVSLTSLAISAILTMVAIAAPMSAEPRAVSEIFYVDWNGQYLNQLNGVDGRNYTVLNDPHNGVFFGAAVYLNKTVLTFAGGSGLGYPVVIPQERGNWLYGKLGSQGTEGFKVSDGVLTFDNKTIYGTFSHGLKSLFDSLWDRAGPKCPGQPNIP